MLHRGFLNNLTYYSMKSHFGICLVAVFLTFMLAACDSRTNEKKGSQKSANLSQATEKIAPEEDELTKLQTRAEQGDANAQFDLGKCFSEGNGMPKDEFEGAKWFRKAAEQGDAKAQYELGGCYDVGNGVTKDLVEAAKWYRLAAEQGIANAQESLGIFLEYGDGVEKNLVEAARWYRKAADQGKASAQSNLGFCYKQGQGVE